MFIISRWLHETEWIGQTDRVCVHPTLVADGELEWSFESYEIVQRHSNTFRGTIAIHTNKLKYGKWAKARKRP